MDGRLDDVAKYMSNVDMMFYQSSDSVSLLENAAHLELPMPEKFQTVLSQLHNKEQDNNNDKDDRK